MKKAANHAGLSQERWQTFPYPKQILMIANEMNRAAQLFGPGDAERLKGSYERCLALADLTIGGPIRSAARKELLRWRDLIAALYVDPAPHPSEHRAAFRSLLLMHPEAALQIPLLEALRE